MHIPSIKLLMCYLNDLVEYSGRPTVDLVYFTVSICNTAKYNDSAEKM